MRLTFFVQHKWAVICLSVIFLLSLLPLIPVILEGGGFHGAAGAYVDSLYVPKAHEVYDGHPLIGSAFYLEHQNGIAAAFILPFWLYALPLIAGLPLAATAELNFTLWSLIFGTILYALFRKFSLMGPWSAIGTVTTYVLMYSWLFTPISMGLVHPVFLLFILTFFVWWDSPTGSRDALLGVATAFAIYEYTYMLQITITFLALVFMHLLLYMRDWPRVRHALFVGIYTSVLCIPFLTMTYMQLHDPNYFESMIRIGLGYTHIPSSEAFRNAARVFSFLALMYVSWKWIFRAREFLQASFALHYALLGIAIVAVSFSNVITGLDLETASHAARFVAIWLIVGSVAAAYFLIGVRATIMRLPLGNKIVFGLIVLSVLAPDIQYVMNIVPWFKNIERSRTTVRDVQAVIPALEWLDANSREPKVVWTNPKGTLYTLIPNYTKHYLLYAGVADVELLSNDEQEERYLVAHALSSTTLESIAADIGDYRGGGATDDTPSTINRGIKVCRVLHFYDRGYPCGSYTDAQIIFAPLFSEMYKKFKTEIQPHLKEELEKFHVTYIMKDAQTDADFHPEKIPYLREVYSDGRFFIYKVTSGSSSH